MSALVALITLDVVKISKEIIRSKVYNCDSLNRIERSEDNYC